MKHYFSHIVSVSVRGDEFSTFRENIVPLLHFCGITEHNPVVFHALYQHLLNMNCPGQTIDLGDDVIIELERLETKQVLNNTRYTYLFSVCFQSFASLNEIRIDWKQLAFDRIGAEFPHLLILFASLPNIDYRWVALRPLSEIKDILK